MLISTYNGEKYIKEQIDSVLNQTYSDVCIYVRDDGSCDSTIDILTEYEKNDQIILIKGNNIGYGQSFLQLLQYAEDGDYWAFCDQDDIWFGDKLEKAVARLEKLNQKEPNMYVHDFFVTDETLNIQYQYGNYIPHYSFQMAITECLHMGFSMVVNRKLRSQMLLGNIANLTTHDWWAELIAMEFGNIYVDDYVGAYHRRLDASVSGSSLKNRIRWFWGALRGESEIPVITREFWNVFESRMADDDRNILELFVSDNYNLMKALYKTCYFRRWRSSLSSEIVVRFLMLVGKI